MKTLGILTLSLLVGATAFGQQTIQQPPPMIIVNGNAEMRVAPDEANVRLGVVRQAPTAQAAQEQTNIAAQAILKGISQLGVSAQSIQSSRLTLSPIYAPRNPESRDAPRIVAYSASNVITVELDNLALLGPVIDAGLKAGANQLEGVQFGLRNDLPAREQALKQAVGEARTKAQAIAAALNLRLGPVLEVQEGGISIMGNDLSMPMNARAFEMKDATPTPVSPGQLEVRANVSIRYRIEGP